MGDQSHPPIPLVPLSSSTCRRISDTPSFTTLAGGSSVTIVGDSGLLERTDVAGVGSPERKGKGNGEEMRVDMSTRQDELEDDDDDDPSEEDELLSGGRSSFAERRPVVYAACKAAGLFLVSLLVLGFLLFFFLPPLREEDKHAIRIPTSFDQLKELNEVLQTYKGNHYWRVLICFTVVYLFIQAFSIPGSMYLSILGGAMFGTLVALPLVCFCVATGALLCYQISAALGPAILSSSEKWRTRLDGWKARVRSVGVHQHHHHSEGGAAHSWSHWILGGAGTDLLCYLIVLRISPLPPHWVFNLLAPHIGISVPVFWISTFFGIGGISVIHVQVGRTLDQMTSSKDFHLLSWQNALGLSAIIVAALAPIFFRRYYNSKHPTPDSGTTDSAADLDEELSESSLESAEEGEGGVFRLDDEDDDEEEEERREASRKGNGH